MILEFDRFPGKAWVLLTESLRKDNILIMFLNKAGL